MGRKGAFQNTRDAMVRLPAATGHDENVARAEQDWARRVCAGRRAEEEYAGVAKRDGDQRAGRVESGGGELALGNRKRHEARNPLGPVDVRHERVL